MDEEHVEYNILSAVQHQCTFCTDEETVGFESQDIKNKQWQ